MLHLLTLILFFDFETGLTYQPLPEDSEEYLSGPAGFVFGGDGKLYLMDSITSRIHVWDAEGKYLFSFGKKGEGPGEFTYPALIDIDERHLWVLDSRGVLSQLDHKGNYIKAFRVNKPRLRRFSVLQENRFLVTTREQVTPTEIYNRIEILDDQGETVTLIKKWRNESFTTPREDNNYASVKAFPPACEIQRGPDGYWYIGFSQNSKLYRVDAKGEIRDELSLGIPGEEPTDEEEAMFAELALPCLGGSFKFKDFPNIHTDFDHNKAYYTSYAVQDDRIVFALTPDGGVFGCNGFPKGNYFVCDRKTGALLDRGSFEFPEGSLLYFHHGHVLGIIIDDEDEFEVRQIKF